jgi:hypothetical protein
MRARRGERGHAHAMSRRGTHSRPATRNGERETRLRQSTGNARNSNALKLSIARRRSGGASKRSVGTRNNGEKNSAGETKKFVDERLVRNLQPNRSFHPTLN